LDLKNSQSEINDLNIHILALELTHSALSTLNFSFVDAQFFQNLTKLVISHSTLESIESKFFTQFSSLNYVELSLRNLKHFLVDDYSQNNTWMKYLNSRNNISPLGLHLTDSIDNEFSGYKFKYEDKYFCSFKHFPHENNVYVTLKPDADLKCTCSIAWLLKNNNNFNIGNNVKPVNGCVINNSSLVNTTLASCNFEQRLAFCEGKSTQNLTNNESGKINSDSADSLTIAVICLASGFTILTFFTLFMYYRSRIFRFKFVPDISYEVDSYIDSNMVKY
jgi:hypothetical protein